MKFHQRNTKKGGCAAEEGVVLHIPVDARGCILRRLNCSVPMIGGKNLDRKNCSREQPHIKPVNIQTVWRIEL